MYGTISKMCVKSGQLDLLLEDGNPPPEDARGSMAVFQMDADPNEIWAVAVAPSEAAWRSLSEKPESHEAYLKRLEALEGPPEWHDGSLLEYRVREAPDGAQLYGTIARLRSKPGAATALRASRTEKRDPGGAVALYLFQMDADPDELYLIGISESEAAHRAYSESPESHKRYLAMREWLEAEPEWHDGRVLRYEFQ